MNHPTTPRLEMRDITKNFGGVHALGGVTLKANAGEVHSVCGENGAGKSTLMKILAGAIADYGGEILLEGRPVKFAGPREAEDAGIRIIYQELNLVPELSVSANLFLGREKTGPFGLLDARGMDRAARELFDRLGTPISPRARVADLRIGDQQMVEIAKALAFDASIVIMDEPTSALSDVEVARLFRVIHDLKAAGTAILYISHKMNEVFTLSDARDRPPRRQVRRDRLAGSPDPSPPRWSAGWSAARSPGSSFDERASRPASGCCRSRAWACPAPPAAVDRRCKDLSVPRRGRRGRRDRRPARRRADRVAREPLRRLPDRLPTARSSSTAQPARFREPERGDRERASPW